MGGSRPLAPHPPMRASPAEHPGLRFSFWLTRREGYISIVVEPSHWSLMLQAQITLKLWPPMTGRTFSASQIRPPQRLHPSARGTLLPDLCGYKGLLRNRILAQVGRKMSRFQRFLIPDVVPVPAGSAILQQPRKHQDRPG